MALIRHRSVCIIALAMLITRTCSDVLCFLDHVCILIIKMNNSATACSKGSDQLLPMLTTV